MKTPILCLMADAQPVDLLDSARAVTAFLREMSPYLVDRHGEAALSERGVDGLFHILLGLENTIDLAIGGLADRP